MQVASSKFKYKYMHITNYMNTLQNMFKMVTVNILPENNNQIIHTVSQSAECLGGVYV